MADATLTSKNCSECSALRDALEFLYAKWEDGVPCTTDGDPDGGPLGHAFQLNDREEKWILSLIPKFSTNPQPPTHETNALLNPQDERGAAILGLEEILRHMPSKDGRWALEYAISKLRPAQKANSCVCGEPNSPGTHRTDGPCLAPIGDHHP